jgi:hypothetical protein
MQTIVNLVSAGWAWPGCPRACGSSSARAWCTGVPLAPAARPQRAVRAGLRDQPGVARRQAANPALARFIAFIGAFKRFFPFALPARGHCALLLLPFRRREFALLHPALGDFACAAAARAVVGLAAGNDLLVGGVGGRGCRLSQAAQGRGRLA